MKHMGVWAKRLLAMAIFFAVLLVGGLITVMVERAWMSLVWFVLIVGATVWLIWSFRCPHCGKVLFYQWGGYCQYCGEPLEDSEREGDG